MKILIVEGFQYSNRKRCKATSSYSILTFPHVTSLQLFLAAKLEATDLPVTATFKSSPIRGHYKLFPILKNLRNESRDRTCHSMHDTYYAGSDDQANSFTDGRISVTAVRALTHWQVEIYLRKQAW